MRTMKPPIPILIAALVSFLLTTSFSQEVTTVSFTIPSRGTGMADLLFHQEIDGVKLHGDDSTSNWQLYQNIQGTWTAQPSQIQRGMPNLLYGRYQDTDVNGEAILFEWRREKSKHEAGIVLEDDGQSIHFRFSDSLVMSYRYALMPVPEGVSQIYSRSGFVHPLKTPAGNLLSRIQPPDHYHHYGLWHPWTHTEYDGEEIDFWNLNKGQGTVIHRDIVGWSEGPLFTELTVLLDHVIHPGRGERTVLKELRTYRIWAPSRSNDHYVLDVIYHMNPSTDKPLTIKEYRYEGFSLRGPQHWSDDNVELLTSQGMNKSNGNGTRARWIKVHGPGNQSGSSTVIFMTNPANYNFPELIRIWPTGTNGGKENVYINFNPTQDRDWVLEPGQTYTLQYRVIMADRDYNAEELNVLWSLYAKNSGDQ